MYPCSRHTQDVTQTRSTANACVVASRSSGPRILLGPRVRFLHMPDCLTFSQRAFVGVASALLAWLALLCPVYPCPLPPFYAAPTWTPPLLPLWIPYRFYVILPIYYPSWTLVSVPRYQPPPQTVVWFWNVPSYPLSGFRVRSFGFYYYFDYWTFWWRYFRFKSALFLRNFSPQFFPSFRNTSPDSDAFVDGGNFKEPNTSSVFPNERAEKKLPKLEYYALFQPSQPGPYDSYLTKLRVYENRIIPNLPNVLKGNMTVANLTKFKDIESVTVTDKVQEFGQELKAKLMPITYLISKLQTQGILPEVASDPGAEQRVKKHLTCLENIRSKIEDFTKNNLDPGSQLSPQQLKVLKSLAASVDNCSSNAQDLRDYLQKSSHGSYILDNIPSVDESIFATLEVHRLLAQLLASLNQ